MSYRQWIQATALVAAVHAAGCTALVGAEVGELRPDLLAKRDVTVSLRDFSPHVGQRVEMEWVENFALFDDVPDRAPLVLATAVVESAPSDCMDIRLLRGAPFVANRVDFYADVNMNGVVDPPADGDHSWREQLDDEGELVFVHDTQFEDLTIDRGSAVLNRFELEITDVSEFEGAAVTVLLVGEDLVDPVENIRRPSVVALYVGRVADGTLALALDGVADQGQTYGVEVRIGDNALVCSIPSQRTPADDGALRVAGSLADFDCAPANIPDCGGLSAACDDGDPDACGELAWQCAFVDCAR